MEFRSCSFTGHRKIEPNHRKIKERIGAGIAYVYERGCRDFYVGGAIGFDTIAAQELILFRMSHPDITFNLVLPCRNQTQVWNDRQREMYDYLLSHADTIEYIADEYYDGCMRERNACLVRRCDVLIAYVGRGRSGAFQTMKMAERAGKTIYNIYNSCDNI